MHTLAWLVGPLVWYLFEREVHLHLQTALMDVDESSSKGGTQSLDIVCWLREMKALLALTDKRASVSSLWKWAWTVCTAALNTRICPAHSRTDPAASCTSSESSDVQDCFVHVSPIPIGCMPGFLSRAMRRLAMCGAILAGSTDSVQRHLAVRAREWHRVPGILTWRRYTAVMMWGCVACK